MFDRLRKRRTIVLLVLAALLIIFTIQNLAAVELKFIFWSFQSRRVVVILLSLLIGLLIGWLYGYNAGWKASKLDK